QPAVNNRLWAGACPDFADRAKTRRAWRSSIGAPGGADLATFGLTGLPEQSEGIGFGRSRDKLAGAAISGGDGGGQGFDAEDVKGAAHVVGKRRQAELGADIFEAAHQERALVHPLLDAAEGM